MLHSARKIVFLAAALWPLCAFAESPVSVVDLPVETEPVLRFEIIEVPGEGKVSAVTGNVERLSGSDRWVLVKRGNRVLHGDQLKVSAGATLALKFSGKQRAEFAAAPKDRWLRFEIAGRPGHET